jgi:hypothetical protein
VAASVVNLYDVTQYCHERKKVFEVSGSCGNNWRPDNPGREFLGRYRVEILPDGFWQRTWSLLAN